MSCCKTLRQSWVEASLPRKVPGKVAVDVTQDLHEVGVHGGEGHTGRLPHVDGALLCQVHVVEVDELELGFLLRPVTTVIFNTESMTLETPDAPKLTPELLLMRFAEQGNAINCKASLRPFVPSKI